MSPISRLALVASFAIPFVLAFLSFLPTARSQSLRTLAVTNGPVAAASAAAAEPVRAGDRFVIVGGQRQLMRSALGTERLWRTPEDALTDILRVRLVTVTCARGMAPWSIEGRVVLCTRATTGELTRPQAAVVELGQIRVALNGKQIMTTAVAELLTTRVAGLIELIRYAQRHHGRAPGDHRHH